MSGVFVQAAVILLREGLEAMLVIAALAAYLKKSGAARAPRRPLYRRGGGDFRQPHCRMAVPDAERRPAQRPDRSLVILVAAALMLYVSGWLLVRQDPRAWQAYLRSGPKARSRKARLGDRAAGVPGSVPRGRRDRAVHLRARELVRRLVGRFVRGTGGRRRRPGDPVLRHQRRGVAPAVAGGVPRDVRTPVPDGDQDDRRCHPGVPGTAHRAVQSGRVPGWMLETDSIRPAKRCWRRAR